MLFIGLIGRLNVIPNQKKKMYRALASIVFMWFGFVLLMIGIVYAFRFNPFLGVLIMLIGACVHVVGISKIIRESERGENAW